MESTHSIYFIGVVAGILYTELKNSAANSKPE